jgi:putative ABC transport system substrate-binding protein
MIYAARILKGDNLADLPIGQSTKIELSVNLKTAKVPASVPASLLARAEEVIE